MRLLIVADGQSPHARNWIHHLVARGHEIHLVSTYPCETESLGVKTSHVVTVDFSAKVRAQEKQAVMGTGAQGTKRSKLSALRGSALWKAFAALRDKTAPHIAVRKAPQVKAIIQEIKPDAVHSMRIPYEGILASRAVEDLSVPFIVSTWGNDFSLYAAGSRTIAKMTRRAMARADALHSDCHKDVRLAEEYGFSNDKLSIVLPGNGGVRTEIFKPGVADPEFQRRYELEGKRVAINPRGLKPYVRNEVFFGAIPAVLKRVPDAVFLCSSMAGKSFAETAAAKWGIEKSVRLLPSVSHEEMANLFRLSELAISPSDHDGTPNTLLEAMACGAMPVAGGIESIREWVDDGFNGVLFDQTSVKSTADAIIRGFEDGVLREAALGRNQAIIAERAAVSAVFDQAEAFYNKVLGAKR